MAVISVNTNEDKTVSIEISVGAEEFEKAVDAAYRKEVKRIQIPGFRKGKAPRKMIEKMYGEGFFYEDAVNATYPAAYQAAVEEKGIEPVDRADIEVKEVGKDGYVFVAKVAVKPEVTLEGYRGIEVEKTVSEATDEEVADEIKRMQEQNGRMVTVEDRAAQMGDTATIDFEGFVDGVAFAGGKGENYPLALGSNSFIPGFEEQVAGHNVGDEFDVNVKFPEEYHAEELKGKDATFKCKLHDIKVKELPEVDDEFAKDVSEFDTLDELKADIRKKIQQRLDDQSQTDVENKLMEAVVGKMEADIPACMFENRISDMVQEFEYRLQSQGLNLQTYLQYSGQTMEQFREGFRAQAESQVKTRLALEKIVALEKIEATEEELNQEFEKIAKNYGMEVEKVKGFVPVEEISGGIAMNKALDLVRDSAKIKEVKAEEKSGQEAEKPKRTRAKKAKEEAPAEAE